jgi:hypothetical protein
MSTDAQIESTSQDAPANDPSQDYAQANENYDPRPRRPEGGDPTPAPSAPSDSPKSSEPGPAAAPVTPPAAAPISRDDYAAFGLTEAQARALDAKDGLGLYCDTFAKQMLTAAQARNQQQPTPDNQVMQQPAPSQVPPQQVPPAVPAEQQVPGLLKVNLDKDAYGEPLLEFGGQVAEVVNSLHAQNARLEAELQEIRAEYDARREREETVEFDRFFGGLGDEYKSIVGEGGISDINHSSAEFLVRQQVVINSRLLEREFQESGMPVPAPDQLRMMALRMAAGDQTDRIAREQVTEQLRNEQGQFISKPTSREAAPLSPHEAAGNFVDNFYKSKGLM